MAGTFAITSVMVWPRARRSRHREVLICCSRPGTDIVLDM
jgi:hypothetical protein